MSDLNPINWWRRLLALPNDSLTKTLVIAFLVAFTASIFVSIAAVTLRPFHLANLERERQERLAEMVAALPGMGDILTGAGVDDMEVHIVDLASGEFTSDIDPATFDQREAARDPALSSTIPSERMLPESNNVQTLRRLLSCARTASCNSWCCPYVVSGISPCSTRIWRSKLTATRLSD